MTPRSYPSSFAVEANPQDVDEQGRAVGDEDEDVTPSADAEVPDADALEQSRTVPIDEDDYR